MQHNTDRPEHANVTVPGHRPRHALLTTAPAQLAHPGVAGTMDWFAPDHPLAGHGHDDNYLAWAAAAKAPGPTGNPTARASSTWASW